MTNFSNIEIISVLAWLVQGKHPGLAIISVLAPVIRVIVSGQITVTTVKTIGFPLMPQKQGALKQQGQ